MLKWDRFNTLCLVKIFLLNSRLMKTILFKSYLSRKTTQFFYLIVLIALNCQQSIASDNMNHRVFNLLKMQEIPAGHFIMGSHKMIFSKPAHSVNIPAFKLSKNEVTYELYDLFVTQTGHDRPMDSWGRGNQPVTNVSWYDAQLFIKWLNRVTTPEKHYRLPTEAEWEYAARAGTQSIYWWGNNMEHNRANCSDCASPWYRQTAPAGSFRPNSFGLNDTSGNVYEWVQDCWHDSFERVSQNSSARIYGDCKYRVIRGGCWYFNHQEIASASRTWNTATKRDSTIGFRIAQDN